MHSLMAVLLLASQANVQPLPPSPAEQAPEQTTSVKLARDENDRMTVGVRVGEAGPFAFLVDTGAERTVISREIADRLKLRAGRPVILRSVLGSSLVPTVKVPALQTGLEQAGSGRARSGRIMVGDAPALPTEHIGADGILGVDTLAGQRVDFDFKRRMMAITPSRGAPARMDGMTIVVEARRRDGRLLFTKASVDGIAVAVVIDTGGEISIGNPELRNRLAHRRPSLGSIEIQTVLGEKANAEIATIHNLEIGAVTLKELKIAFTDAPIFRQLRVDKKPALLLGMNAMRAFDRVSLDFATRKVRFVLPGTSAQP